MSTNATKFYFTPPAELVMRKPKPVRWEPKPDITTYELAQAVPILVGSMSLGAISIEDEILKLPPEAQRHFRIEPYKNP